MNDVLAATRSELQLGDAAQAILEARTQPRVGVDFPATVFSGDFSGALAASARDISVDGVCLATPSMFSFKSIRRVRLDLAGGPLELNAEGRWQSGSTGDDSIITGVKFTNPDKRAVSQLWSVVNAASKELALFLFDRSDLSDLCADDATSLADFSRYRMVSARRRIYRQDERRPGDDSIFVVLRGEVSLMAQLGNHREVILGQPLRWAPRRCRPAQPGIGCRGLTDDPVRDFAHVVHIPACRKTAARSTSCTHRHARSASSFAQVGRTRVPVRVTTQFDDSFVV